MEAFPKICNIFKPLLCLYKCYYVCYNNSFCCVTDGISKTNRRKVLFMTFKRFCGPHLYKVGRFCGGWKDVLCMLEREGRAIESAIDAYITLMLKNCSNKAFVYLPMCYSPNNPDNPDLYYLPRATNLAGKIILAPVLQRYTEYDYHTYLAVINFNTKMVTVFDPKENTVEDEDITAFCLNLVRRLMSHCEVGYPFEKKLWTVYIMGDTLQQPDLFSHGFVTAWYAGNIIRGQASHNNKKCFQNPKGMLKIKYDFLTRIMKTTKKGKKILASLSR